MHGTACRFRTHYSDGESYPTGNFINPTRKNEENSFIKQGVLLLRNDSIAGSHWPVHRKFAEHSPETADAKTASPESGEAGQIGRTGFEPVAFTLKG